MRIISFDPGLHTGWATFDDGHFETGCLEGDEHHYEVFRMLNDNHWDLVLYERFSYQKRPDAPSLDLTAAEIIGVIKLFKHSAAQVVERQRLGKTKSFWSDDKLRKIGFYPGNRHERDAMRILLHHLSFELNDRTWMFMLKD